jgi:hypothetical protein
MSTTTQAAAFSYRRIANELDEHMQYRAAREGVAYELTAGFLEFVIDERKKPNVTSTRSIWGGRRAKLRQSH